MPEHPRTVPLKGRKLPPKAWALGLSLAALVGALCVILPQTTVIRERQLMRRPLPALLREQSHHWDDPVYLSVLGKRLNQSGRYTEADPVLRRCVGLEPDRASYRDEWAQALLGSGLTTAAFAELREFVGTHPASAEGHRAFGKFYLTQSSFARADEELRSAVALNPRDAAAWAYSAQVADSLQDPARAAADAARAVQLQDRDETYHRLYAGILSQLSRTDAARREYEQAVALAPGDAQAHREYAQWLLRQAMDPATMATALREAQRAATLSPDDGQIRFVLGQALAAAGQGRASLVPLRLAAQTLTDAPAPALALARQLRLQRQTSDAATWGREYLRRQQYVDQVRQLTQELSIHPQNRDVQTRLAVIMGRHGDVEACVRHHAMALHSAIDSPLVMIAAAQDLTAGGYAARALPLAERGVQIARQNESAFETLGDVLLALGRYDGAVKQYQDAVRWDRERTPILRARLKRYVQAQAKEAERYFLTASQMAATSVGLRRFTPQGIALVEKAISIEPENTRFLHFLLDAQIAQKKMPEAVVTAQRLVRVAPRDASAHALLAVLLTDTASSPADYRTIEEHLKAAAGAPSVDATRHYGLGLLALRRRQARTAVAELTEAVRLDPTADVTYYKLSQADQAAGNMAAASRAMAVYQTRQEAKRQEAALLSSIGAHRTQAGGYVRLASFYRRRGLVLQAQAVLTAASHHCSRRDLQLAERNSPKTL